MKITMLAGGVGGAKFALGLRSLLQADHPDHELRIIANVGDDMWLTGLKVCPDLDSLMYALAGVNDSQRGWGREGESTRVSAELSEFGVGWPWFTLGDLDLGTHIARSALLREGLPLSAVTRRLSDRWELGARLLPAAETDLETWVELEAGHAESGTVHFEEWWVRLRAGIPAQRFHQRGGQPAQPGAGVLESITEADAVLIAPSNPVVSIGTICGFPAAAPGTPGSRDAAGAPGIPGAPELPVTPGINGIPEITEALRTTRAPVVGVSPIIDSSPLRGMARQCLETLGWECSARAVGLAYGARSAGGLLDGWLVDEADAADLPELRSAGLHAQAAPLWMTDRATSKDLAASALQLAGLLRSAPG